MTELNDYTAFLEGVQTWHRKGRYLPELNEQVLTELFTRWNFATGAPSFFLEAADNTPFLDKEGNPVIHQEVAGDRGLFAIHRDTGEIRYQGVKGKDYTPHSAMDWLVEPALEIVAGAKNAGAEVVSAINLGGGNHCAITVELKSTSQYSGVEMRPYLSFTTGHSLATCAIRGSIMVVCDNTADAAIYAGVRVKHTKFSLDRLASDYQSTIAEWVESTETAADPVWVGMLANSPITDEQFDAILDTWCPMPQGVKTTVASQRHTTMRANIREEIATMWATDSRCTLFQGTLMSAYQALSTHDHFNGRTRGNGVVNDRKSQVLSKLTMARFFPTFQNKDRDSKHFSASTHDRVLATIAQAIKLPELVSA